jgi:hypothetical protein
MTWRPVLFRPHCPKRGATRSNAAVQPAFGALFACLWLGEKISLTAWVGGGLIVVASMLATVRWRKAVTVSVPRAAEAVR